MGRALGVKLILFCASGMLGQATLLECFRDPEVERVLAVGRTPLGRTHPKLTELVRADL